MSMMQKAIELKSAVSRLMYSDNKDIRDYNELIDFIESALRPVSREQVEKVWRGEWEYPGYYDDGGNFVRDCKRCGAPNMEEYIFCPHCGAPMTDEAVGIMLERLRKMNEE